MSRKNITIGLFGFGCVGHGLHEVLQKTPTLKTTIKKICVKDPHKERQIAKEHFTFEKNDLLFDKDINVIVELIDDADAAFEIVSTALKNGKAVVTANKKMLAEHFNELLALQEEYKVPLLYEAACCASIPVIRNLEEYYNNDLLLSIEGILNGSTNYILTKTFSENLTYQEALKEAQQKGYAESNPLLDTSGTDAKNKLLILIAHAFGLVLQPEDIFTVGIDKLKETEINYAREKGLKIKLVAHAEKTAQGLRVFVMPKFVYPEDKLFEVDDVFNGIKIKSCFSDVQFFSGKGAGAHPTASAVISDLSALTYDYRYEYKKLKSEANLEIEKDISLKILWNHKRNETQHLDLLFNEVIETYYKNAEGYLIGNISLKNLKKLLQIQPESSVVLFEVIDKLEKSFYFDLAKLDEKEVLV